jgi:AcrR family transcriptional regulator
MGRKSLSRKRKEITPKVNSWLGELLLQLQYEDLDKLPMDDIARLVGKSKSTIYEYFESKEDIFLAACQTRLRFLVESGLNGVQQGCSTVERYERLVEVFAEGTAGISIHFLQSIKQQYPKAWEAIEGFTNSYIDLLKEQYRQGMAEGIYNPISIELLGFLDRLFVTQVVTNPDFFSDEQYTISNLVRDYLKLRLHGLLKK